MPRASWSAKDHERGLREGYRSGLEKDNQDRLRRLGVPFAYEGVKIRFTYPARSAIYTPDFVLVNNGIIVETKGQFVTADRQKHLLVREQEPDLDIRFVFSAPSARISKQSRTTYADWCSGKNPKSAVFKFHGLLVPEAWTKEPPNQASLAALRRLGFDC